MGSSPKQEITEYLMSIHFGISAPPLDSINGIYVGEKEAWAGNQASEASISIDKPDLFGGEKTEGGVGGIAYYLPGGVTQVLPDGLCSRWGLTGATSPGFRGFSSIFFGAAVGGGGFYWGNQPYLRGVWVRGRRAPKGLNPIYASIEDGDADRLNGNPAHMIYESLVNTDWGMGCPTALIDADSFEDVGETLHDEDFGLSMLWTRQAAIEDFVSEILDHIQAVMFQDPESGLWTIKLIRDDYDPDELPVFTPDNANLSSFERKGFGETINEIQVTWTNPVNEQEETVVAQNLANINIQGEIISDSRNYYGIRNAEKAMEVAVRDVRSASTPLASCDMEVDRTQWRIRPGSVVKVSWPEKKLTEVIMRVGSVDYGKPGEPMIKVSLLEDVFGLDQASYVVPSGSGWVDPSADPEPVDYAQVLTLPYYFVETTLPAYPEVISGTLAATDAKDVLNYDVMGSTVDTLGNTVPTLVGQSRLVGRGTLPADLAQAASSVTTFLNVMAPAPVVGGLVMIGTGGDETTEFCLISAFAGGNYTLKRGVLDTTPKAWPAGTPVWFLTANSNIDNEDGGYSDGEAVSFEILTRTSKGRLAVGDGVDVAGTLTGRPHLPTRPANVKVEGVAFGIFDNEVAGLSALTVTWNTRNRLLEDTAILDWDDADVAEEAGQTTTVQAINSDGVTVDFEANGLTGGTYELPASSWGGGSSGYVRVISKRDGLESLQGHMIRVILTDFGYGDAYGDNYGGG